MLPSGAFNSRLLMGRARAQHCAGWTEDFVGGDAIGGVEERLFNELSAGKDRQSEKSTLVHLYWSSRRCTAFQG